MALIAQAIMEPTSETVADRMSASVVLDSSPNFLWRHLVRVIHTFCRPRKQGHGQGIVTENEPFAPSRRAVGERKSSYSESDLREFSSVS